MLEVGRNGRRSIYLIPEDEDFSQIPLGYCVLKDAGWVPLKTIHPEYRLFFREKEVVEYYSRLDIFPILIDSFLGGAVQTIPGFRLVVAYRYNTMHHKIESVDYVKIGKFRMVRKRL